MISSFLSKIATALMAPIILSLGILSAPQQIQGLQYQISATQEQISQVQKISQLPVPSQKMLITAPIPAPVVAVPAAAQKQTFGSTFSPAGGLTYRLSASIGTTNASVPLSSFKNRSSINLTMSTLNTSIGYGTLDPQNPDRSEFISFTGVTQNSDGTALLTGVTRGLSDIYPFAASTTLSRTHPGQSIFILSDAPTLFTEYAVKRNAETISGVWTFTAGSNPKYSSNPAGFGANDLVNYQTLINTAISGAATSTFSNMGIVQLATQSQMASGTASSTEGRPLVLSSKFSTTTYNPGNAINIIPVTDSSGTISNQFIATSSTNTYRFAGAFFLTGTTTLNATTTIAAASSTSPLCINGLCAGYPSEPAASSSILTTTGGTNADVTWTPAYSRKIYQTTGDVTDTGVASTTLMTFTLPANALGPAGTLHLHGNFDGFGATPNNMIMGITAGGISIGYASSTFSGAINKAVANGGIIDVYINAAGVTNAQENFVRYSVDDTADCSTVAGCIMAQNNSSAFDSTTAQTIALVVRFGTAGGQTQIIFRNGYAELIR